MKDVEALADEVHRFGNIAASISSGSYRTIGMLVMPCSIKPLPPRKLGGLLSMPRSEVTIAFRGLGSTGPRPARPPWSGVGLAGAAA